MSCHQKRLITARLRYRLMSLLILIWPWNPVLGQEGPAVALVGDRRIEAEDLKDRIVEERKTGDMKKVLRSLTPEGQREILGELIDAELLALRARALGLEKDPEILRAINRAVREVLAKAFLEREMQRLDFSEAGLRAYYESHLQDFTTGVRVRARQINTKTLEEAQTALQEIRGGKAFSAVASERNIDASRSRGGDLGWVSRGTMVAPFEKALFALAPGQVSEIVETSFGFHIILAEEIDPGKPIPFEKVKDVARARMIEDRRNGLAMELRKLYPVKIHEEVLKTLPK